MCDASPRREITEEIIGSGVVAVVRMREAEHAVRVTEALRAGGIPTIEIAMTTPRALEIIGEISKKSADREVLIGAGSVLDSETVRSAANAGARYIVSPIFNREVVASAHRQGIPAIPGAFTPTEIHRAHEAGADLVKVFPASTVGANYCKAVQAPLPHLELIPTGGITPENAGDWIQAGASAVGVGSALVDEEAIAAQNFHQITENAGEMRQIVEEARAH